MSMEFSRQEYWCGLPFLSPGNLPNLGIKSWFPTLQAGIKPWYPTLQADSLPSEPPGKAIGSLFKPKLFLYVLLKTSGIQLCKTSEILLVFFTCCLAPERIHGVYTLGLKFQVMKRLRKFEKVKSNKIINKFHSLFFLALKKSFFLGISFPFNVYIN